MTPRRLGRYELTHRLGEGGQGEVWAATLHGPSGFRRRVAVKVLGPEQQGRSPHDALVQEARLGGLVSHPNVVSTLELEQHEGVWFLVMELVRGRSTLALATEGALSPAALVDIGVQTCRGLAHIHGLTDDDGRPLELVHRDIKPANLLLDDTGLVRIVDLGIARLVGGEGEPAGTIGYCSPEVLSGEEDARSDLFSLGATLVHLAIGERPLGGSTRHLRRLLDVERFLGSPEVLQRVEDVVPGLGAVVYTATRTEPEDRYGSAVDMAAALADLYGGIQEPKRVVSVAGTLPSSFFGTPAMAPVRRDALLGRDRELSRLRRCVQQGGVVAVTGPPGVGKTALVEEFLLGLVDRERLRCDLAVVRSEEGLRRVVADGLGVFCGADADSSIGRALAARDDVVLVLDHADPTVPWLSGVLDAWRGKAPAACIVVTTRVSLGLEGSVELRLGPLPMAAARQLLRRHVKSPVNDEHAEQLVRGVDRLPLSIELAASRVSATSVTEVLVAMRRDPGALWGEARAGIAASWALLAPNARAALARLASFEASFDAQDAAAVLAGLAEPMGLLQQLCDHSMLQVRRQRFRVLRLVRAFVLAEADAEAVNVGERRHGAWMARLGAAELDFSARGTHRFRRRVSRALDDLVVAHHRAIARGDGSVAVDAALAASMALMQTGPMTAAVPLLEQAATVGLRTHEVQERLGSLLFNLRRREEAAALLVRGMATATGLELAAYQATLGNVRMRDDPEGAIELLEKAWIVQKFRGDLRYFETLGEIGVVQGLRLGDVAGGIATLKRSVDGSRAAGLSSSYHDGHLATLYSLDMQLDVAMPLFERTLSDLTGLGRFRLASVYRANFAICLLLAGRDEEADQAAQLAYEQGRRVGRLSVSGPCLALRSHVARRAGRSTEAVALAREGLQEVESIDAPGARCDALVALAQALESEGRVEEGQSALHEAVGLGAWLDEVMWKETTLQVARWGRGDDRDQALTGRPPVKLPYARALGELEDGWWAVHDGDLDGARRHLAVARSQLRSFALASTAPAWRQLALLEQASAP